MAKIKYSQLILKWRKIIERIFFVLQYFSWTFLKLRDLCLYSVTYDFVFLCFVCVQMCLCLCVCMRFLCFSFVIFFSVCFSFLACFYFSYIVFYCDFQISVFLLKLENIKDIILGMWGTREALRGAGDVKT